jgi:hypothetical protein
VLSFVVIRYQQDVIAALLESACPKGASRFWLKMLNMLQIMGPLLLVVWRSSSEAYVANPMAEFKAAFSMMLLGHCAALIIISRNVWVTFVAPADGGDKTARQPSLQAANNKASV